MNKVPNKNNLLKELDSIGHSERIRKISLLGRDNKDLKEYSELLHELINGGAYEANLALIGARVTRNIDIVLISLKHNKTSIRNTASWMLAVVGTDEDIIREIDDLSYVCRQKLLNSIYKNNRKELAEKIIESVIFKWGVNEAKIILPLCKIDTITRFIDKYSYCINNWKILSLRYPELILNHFKKTLQNSSTRVMTNVWYEFYSAIEVLCKMEYKVEEILDCAILIGPFDTIPRVLINNIGTLIKNYPSKFYTILIRKESIKDLTRYNFPKSAFSKLKYFKIEQIIEIAKILKENSSDFNNLLKNIAPSNRAEIFEAVFNKENRQERIFSESLLHLLPHTLRDEEAKRMLTLREISEKRESIIDTLAFRLINNSQDDLKSYSQSSNATERAKAYSKLIKSAFLSRTNIDETLEYLCRIKNDQDPVRIAVFMELSISPPSMIKDSSIPMLTTLINSAIEARDTSASTIMYIQKFILTLLKYNQSNTQSEIFKFATDTFLKAVKHTGQTYLSWLNKNTISGMEKIIFDILHPLIIEWNKRENYGFIISLATFLGRKGDDIEELQDLIKQAIKAKPDYTATQAIKLWIKPKKTRDIRVKELIDKDKSVIKIWEVFAHLHFRRQEWLDPFITANVVKGNFLTGNSIYLVYAIDGFKRWLPRQQKSFLNLVEKFVFDKKQKTSARISKIKIMSKFPDVFPEKLVELAKNEDVPTSEAALHALSYLEESEKAIEVLLENIDSNKARVAMYSFNRCIKNLNPSKLISILEEILDHDKLKITVRKESIRLLSVYKSKQSIELILKEYKKPNIHKDVLISIGFAARNILEENSMWKILEDLSSSTQIDVVRSILNQSPSDLPEVHKVKYLDIILKTCYHKEADIRREVFHYLNNWINVNENKIAEVTSQAIIDLDDSVKWKYSINLLTEICCQGKIDNIIEDVFKQLTNTFVDDNINADLKRDLPHRQRLIKFTECLALLPNHKRLKLIPLYNKLITCISVDQTLLNIKIKLYIASIDWNNIEDTVERINNISSCIKLQPYFLLTVHKQIFNNLRNSDGYYEDDKIINILKIIQANGSIQDKCVAISLLEFIGVKLYWESDCRNLLKLFREDENVEVRSLSLDVWTKLE